MNEIDGSRDVFLKMAIDLEKKPTIEESQLNRKSRYFQRVMFPKPPEEKKPKKKRIQDDSDDEMPAPKPKIPKKKISEKKGKILAFVDMVDDESFDKSSTPIFIDLTMSDEENMEPVGVVAKEKPEKSEIRTMNTRNRRLTGRLPKWFLSRKSKKEERERRDAEKRDERLKCEKEAEEAERQETQTERRRFLDRLRHQKRRDEKNKKKDSGGKDSLEDVTKNKRKKETLEEGKRVRKIVTMMITDPAKNPSEISLEQPELVPWAPNPKNSKKKTTNLMKKEEEEEEEEEEAPPTSNSFAFSPASMMTSSGGEEEEEEGGGEDVGNQMTEILPIDILQIGERLFFEDNEATEYLQIPDEEIELIGEEDDQQEVTFLTDTFLSYFDDDEVPVAELDQYLN